MKFRPWLAMLACSLVMMGGSAHAASDAAHPKQVAWPFDGVVGNFDRPAIQRGYQVYKQVCASCHGMKRIRFRDLQAVGFSEAEVKEIAAGFTYPDGPNQDGEMFERPGRPSDAFPSPFANSEAARAANNGAVPPDLSLIIKARPDGANYVYSLLTGYASAPEGVEVPDGMHYNPYFSGGKIAMAAPLAAGALEYQDGTATTVDQMSRDVVSFLQWASEPEMEQRKEMGLKVLIFLAIATIFFFVAKKIIWRDVK